MGEYCAVRDVRLALSPEGNQTDQTAAMLEDSQLEDAIREAEDIVDAHILARYQIVSFEMEVPNPLDALEIWVFMVAPAPIWAWTRDLAAFLATLTFRKHKDLEERDPIALRYKMVMDMLLAVRDGRMQLQLPPPTVDESTVLPEAFNIYDGVLFAMEDFRLGPEGMSRNPQRLWPHDRIDV